MSPNFTWWINESSINVLLFCNINAFKAIDSTSTSIGFLTTKYKYKFFNHKIRVNDPRVRVSGRKTHACAWVAGCPTHFKSVQCEKCARECHTCAWMTNPRMRVKSVFARARERQAPHARDWQFVRVGDHATHARDWQIGACAWAARLSCACVT